MVAAFATDPLLFVSGEARDIATANLRRYFRQDEAGYTGSWFERLAPSSEPNTVTVQDTAAVTTLGVTIPAHITIALTRDADQVSELLRQIGAEQTIWDPDAALGPDSPAARLWTLIRRASWAGHSGKMGRTKTSKLLAVKRPHLIPIYDDWVARALWAKEPKGSYWQPWAERCAGPHGVDLRQRIDSLRPEGHVPDKVSTLRVLDVVIWMWARSTGSKAWDLGAALR